METKACVCVCTCMTDYVGTQNQSLIEYKTFSVSVDDWSQLRVKLAKHWFLSLVSAYVDMVGVKRCHEHSASLWQLTITSHLHINGDILQASRLKMHV